MKNVAVLLPVLNETENVIELIEKLTTSFRDFNARIFFVDDGSTDGTIEKLENAQKRHAAILVFNRQKEKQGCRRGEALVYALRKSVIDFNPDYFVELDGDLSHNPEEIQKGINLIDAGADVALGSKYLSNSKIEGRSFVRNTISYANSLLFRLFLGFEISDYSNGFRVYNQKAAKTILESRIKYGSPIYLAEAIVIWKLHRMKFAEFPITYNGRKKGSSKVILSDVVKGLAGALAISTSYYRRRLGI